MATKTYDVATARYIEKQSPHTLDPEKVQAALAALWRCSLCAGTGKVQWSAREMADGFGRNGNACPRCEGTGR